MSLKKLKIVFMGTPDFAVASLNALVKNGFNVVGVITAPDKPAGRGQKIQMSAVKEYALTNNLHILQPTNLKDEIFLEELKALGADLQIVVAFRMLPERVWNMPEYGTYNLHASLLPKYRGAAPINWSIINGDTESGVTTFKLTHEIDTGNILFQEKVKINETTNAGELHDLLMEVGAGLIVKTVKVIEEHANGRGELNFIKQDDTAATHAPKIFKETCKINWSEPISKVFNLIRGMSPYPAAYTELVDANGQTLSMKIFSAEKIDENLEGSFGKVYTDNKTYFKIACNGGSLLVKELQLQGKKRMTTKEFLNGYKFPHDTILK
jgi:methionyl-tRNA formyltransferase